MPGTYNIVIRVNRVNIWVSIQLVSSIGVNLKSTELNMYRLSSSVAIVSKWRVSTTVYITKSIQFSCVSVSTEVARTV